jgi:hypothetical protein
MAMSVTVNRNPFSPLEGFEITVVDGTPPFTYVAWNSPPNPTGVTVLPNGATADVSVPPGTPPGQKVRVDVTDSSNPPQTRTAQSTTK